MLVALSAGLSGSCHRAFTCSQDEQCSLAGQTGFCEATGSCSFLDDSCSSGRRYGAHAQQDLVDQCVDEASSGSGSGSDDSGGSSTTDPGECPPLVESGPVVVSEDGQVIEGLRIFADGVPGITVSGRQDVVIRNCEIHHVNGPGISFAAADNLTIDTVVVEHDRTDPGPHADSTQVNITGTNSANLRISRVRVARGASGIDLSATPGAILETIEGHDIRGPGPPASFIQLLDSDEVVISDFSCINPLDTGRPGNLIAIFESSDVTVRDGLLDGHNSVFGYGILFNQTSGQNSGGVVEDVDAIRMTNGAFSGFPTAYELEFRRTRVRDNICDIVSVPIEDCDEIGPMGGCVPGSDGRSWTGAMPLSDLLIEDSRYFGLCILPVWPESAFSTCDGDSSSLPPGDCGLIEEDFTLREPTVIQPCWEQ